MAMKGIFAHALRGKTGGASRVRAGVQGLSTPGTALLVQRHPGHYHYSQGAL
jgi:hypothetical protein